MTSSSLDAQPVKDLIDDCIVQAQRITGCDTVPKVVVSPYRFNPLGAHIDHQGGQVLARCLNQYTILCFWPSDDPKTTVHAKLAQGTWQNTCFLPMQLDDEHGWDSMARAAITALHENSNTQLGVEAVVFGTMVSCGLSSSASVILAYLAALAHVNEIELTQEQYVELSRQVENDYRGLNNGIQDQMSIVFGQRDHMARLDVQSVTAALIADPPKMEQYRFLMCYSGVSRDLGGSPFNTRVAQCQTAANLLYPGATHLGEVPEASRHAFSELPEPLVGRAKNVYTEMARVKAGAEAWQAGNVELFGQLMNASCQSSINDYESGSEWLIALHEIAREIPGVYGNRFSGGGYGGCLFLLVDANKADDIAVSLMEQYIQLYPDLQGVAKILVADTESTVRVLQP